MNISTSPLSREVIFALYSNYLDQPPMKRIVYMYLDYSKVKLANVFSLLLNCLEEIRGVASASDSLGTGGSSPTDEFIMVTRETKYPFGDPKIISTFVLTALFSTILGAIFPQRNTMNKGTF